MNTMASKTIMIQEDTYNRLLKMKRENESFNDLILRLMGQQQDILPFFGFLGEQAGNEIDQVIEKDRLIIDQADEIRGDGS